MRALQLSIRGFCFCFLVFGIASALGFALGGPVGSAVAVSLLALFFLWVALGWRRLWTKELKGKRVQILDSIEVFYVNDPASHVVLLSSPLGRRGAVFMTRGILSLLGPEELEEVLNVAQSYLHQTGLGWETFLSSLQLRLLRRIPTEMRKTFFQGPVSPRGPRLYQVLIALPILGFIDFFRRLYLPEPNLSPIRVSRKKVVFQRLFNESLVCTPMMTPAAAPHSIVDPWPNALMRTGRSCLSTQASLTSLG